MNWFILLIIVAVGLEAIADIFFKNWALQNKGWFLGVGILLYSIGTLVWAYSLRQEHLSKAISIFTVVNLIVVMLIGVFYFKEGLTLTSKIGIALGVISVLLMQKG